MSDSNNSSSNNNSRKSTSGAATPGRPRPAGRTNTSSTSSNNTSTNTPVASRGGGAVVEGERRATGRGRGRGHRGAPRRVSATAAPEATEELNVRGSALRGRGGRGGRGSGRGRGRAATAQAAITTAAAEAAATVTETTTVLPESNNSDNSLPPNKSSKDNERGRRGRGASRGGRPTAPRRAAGRGALRINAKRSNKIAQNVRREKDNESQSCDDDQTQVVNNTTSHRTNQKAVAVIIGSNENDDTMEPDLMMVEDMKAVHVSEVVPEVSTPQLALITAAEVLNTTTTTVLDNKDDIDTAKTVATVAPVVALPDLSVVTDNDTDTVLTTITTAPAPAPTLSTASLPSSVLLSKPAANTPSVVILSRHAPASSPVTLLESATTGVPLVAKVKKGGGRKLVKRKKAVEKVVDGTDTQDQNVAAVVLDTDCINNSNDDNSNNNDSDNNNNNSSPDVLQRDGQETNEQHCISMTTALEQLPCRQVSITANTQLLVRRKPSAEASTTTSTNQSTDATVNDTSVSTDTGKKKKSRKTSTLSNTAAQQQKLARQFNQDVRICVDRSDPHALSKLLRDKKNHKYALDSLTLEICLKAYIVAAMLEDALYCLRHVTQPATLSTLQTERILSCLPQNLRNSSAYTAADMLNSICIATEFPSPSCRTYFLRIVRGIALEFLEEATSSRDRICSSPCERLVRAGVCVVNCRFKRGKKPTELVVLPGDQLGVFVAENDADNRGIQAGDAVGILPYVGPYSMTAESLDRNMIEATVTNTSPMVLRLQDKTNVNLHTLLTDPTDNSLFRIDKLANRMGFNRQLAAATSMASFVPDKTANNNKLSYDTRRPSYELIKAITAMDENIHRVMTNGIMKPYSTSTTALHTTGHHLHNHASMNHSDLTSTAALCAEAIPWSIDDETDETTDKQTDQEAIRASVRLALEKFGALEGLNASQQLAVEGACTNRLTLIQGPPGTGKTAVAIRILEHWARMAAAAAGKGEHAVPIVATSDSNIAVDNLVDGCASVGLKVIRLGRPEAIRPELLRYCIDRPPQSSYSGNERQQQSGSPYGFGSPGTNFYKERVNQLKSAQVICCTCIGSGGDIMDSLGPLDHVLVDEATQATEAAVLVPLMRGCRQLVLVGDHCQLPPTVLSTRAEEEGHGVPLFSRMVACGVPPFMLDTQYRMHPCIAMFPSDLFYGGLLRNGVTAPERRPLAGFPWPREEFPVAFIPIKGVEMDDGVSKYNEDEAAAAVNAVTVLLEGGQCTASDIAVVTPYAAQARLIRRLVRRLSPNAGPPYIEVSSVDGFQGREKEAVVFSAVRSNDYGAIGFTSDWRRINVSFTRARRALIVIGNDQTLRRGDPDTWMPWLAWADAHGLNMDKPGVPRGRYEPEQLRRVRGGTTAAEMLKDVLQRQQAQLKSAERQQERAERNARGNIVAKAEEDKNVDGSLEDGTKQVVVTRALTLEEDIALMENTDGNWDDSDEEDETTDLRHSVSKVTLTSNTSSSNDLQHQSNDQDDTGVNIWDM